MTFRGHDSRLRAQAIALVALLAATTTLAGCVGRDEGSGLRADSPEAAAASDRAETGWQVGNWWAYRATFEENQSVDIALIVFEAADGHFMLGSNLSAGFFGLPFNGNVTRPNLNPVIAGEEWRLFEFPLTQGRSWQYELFGYTLTARAVEATVEAPRIGPHAGFALEASSFGRTVVAYTYSPRIEWFTRLVLYEPTDGHEVVRVELIDYGERYGADYYVNVPIRDVHETYPGLPDPKRLPVEGSYLRLYGTVSLSGKVGRFEFKLRDPSGRIAMSGEVMPTGAFLDRKELDPAPGAWTLSGLGLGQGGLHFEMTALRPARDGRVLAAGEPSSLRGDPGHAPTVDFPALLAPASPAPAAAAPGGALSLPALRLG